MRMLRGLLFAALLLPIACQTGSPAATGGDTARQIRVVKLQHARATTVAPLLREGGGDAAAGPGSQLRVAVQESTNSVIVAGSTAAIEAALAAIARLDVPDDAADR